MKSYAVRIWEIQVNQLRKGKSYTVRWKVGRNPFSKTFAKRPLADGYRSALKQAVANGEGFDVDSGLPASLEPPPASVSVLAHAVRYVAMKWPAAAAKSRDSMTDALATVVPALTADEPGRPASAVLRRLLREYVLVPSSSGDCPAELAAALRWLENASLPVAALTNAETVRRGLDAVALQLDGTAAAPNTRRRKRAVFYNLLQYAIELEILDANPIDKLKVTTKRTRTLVAIDRRVVVNPRQAAELLTAVSYVGRRGLGGTRGERLVAFFGCLYFAGLRPEEALGLSESDCQLPETGWGAITLDVTRPSAGRRWTDSGEVHDDRGLKHRDERETRRVPIPPVLVALLRRHVRRFCVQPGASLFRSTGGKPVGASTYSRVWKEARQFGLSPVQVASPLAARPYDLRHAALSTWLNAGVSVPEVAERAGNSPEVVLAVYAKCLDADAERMNSRIAAALADVVWSVADV